MKVGSIVECIRGLSLAVRVNHPHLVCPIKGNYYTVRAIFKHEGDVGLLLEEIKNPKVHTLDAGYKEQCFDASLFREVEFPPALMEEITEMLTEPILVEA